MTAEAAQLGVQISHLLEIGRTADARRLLGRMLELAPGDAEALFLAARIAHEDKQPMDARARIADVLAAEPDHHGARLLLVELEMDAERFDQAEALLLELLREEPEDALLLAVYGRLMLRVYQLDKARALVDESLRRAPELPLAQTLDALLHIIHGDDASASARLAQLIADDPEAEHVAWTAMAVLQSQRRPREVLEIGRQLLRTQPHSQDLVDLLIEARANSHWSMKPLWPMLKFGWGGAIAVWMTGVVAFRVFRSQLPQSVVGPLVSLYLGYVIYSWVWPSLLRRWLRRKGF